MPFKDISYLQLWQPFCLAEVRHLSNFSRGHYEEHFCDFILNLNQWLRRCCLNISYLPFVQRSRTICTILAEGIMGNILVKLF